MCKNCLLEDIPDELTEWSLPKAVPRITSKISKTDVMIIHPIIIAIFPVLALYAHNIRNTELRQLVLPLSCILITTLIVWVLLRRLTRHAEKAALMTSAALFFFFAYGHVFEIINSIVKPDNAAQIDWILLPGWTVLLAIISVWLYKTRLQLTTFTKLINVFSLTLISLSCAKIGWFVVNNASAGKPNPAMATASTLDDQVAGQPTIMTRPDIYFILLDAYARGDILRDYYNYDNTPLLRAPNKMA